MTMLPSVVVGLDGVTFGSGAGVTALGVPRPEGGAPNFDAGPAIELLMRLPANGGLNRVAGVCGASGFGSANDFDAGAPRSCGSRGGVGCLNADSSIGTIGGGAAWTCPDTEGPEDDGGISM
jgi:hypothetical protein